MLAVVALLALTPVFLVVGLAVYVFLGRPVVFQQVRTGLDETRFVLLKFRTMREAKRDCPADDASRMTRFGSLLRSTSLDELPSLVNVIRGEMNLIGPRPLLPEYVPLYTARQARRHEVRPGITGWAQVNGRNSLSWDEKFEHDVWYVENQSLLLDARILAMTIQQVLLGRGITQPGEATAERFEGSVGQ
jgi:lipopolysaccharide/colanic/teichoic acid biosynthesis glycosyltransferase